MASSSSSTGGGRFTADLETAIQHVKDAVRNGTDDVEAAFAPLHRLLDQQRGDAPAAPAIEEAGPAPVTVVSQARDANQADAETPLATTGAEQPAEPDTQQPTT